MTVQDFNDKRKDIDRTLEDLQKGADAIAKVFDVLQGKKTKIPDETMELVRPGLNQAIIAANEAVKKLRDYGYLLDDIARSTQLDWPPKCGGPK